MTIRVALIDDHPLILKILHQELNRIADIAILWETTNSDEMFRLLNEQTPDVLVLDLFFSGQGFEPVTAVRDLRARFPNMAILILTAHDDPLWIEELIQVGVQGYVVKSDDFSLRLGEGIRAVAQGRTFLSSTAVMGLTASRQKYTLTSRERTILRLAAQGYSNPQIAETLNVANGTVRNHISNIYTKLNVDTREAAIRAAQSLRELPKQGASTRHELRTPLHTMLGLARLLQTKLEKNGHLKADESGEFLEQIILEAERLDRLIGDIGE